MSGSRTEASTENCVSHLTALSLSFAFCVMGILTVIISGLCFGLNEIIYAELFIIRGVTI